MMYVNSYSVCWNFYELPSFRGHGKHADLPLQRVQFAALIRGEALRRWRYISPDCLQAYRPHWRYNNWWIIGIKIMIEQFVFRCPQYCFFCNL